MKNRPLRILLVLGSAFVGISAGKDPEEVMADARITRVKADCMALTSALKVYKINAGHYPSEKQGLKALVEKPTMEPRPVDWVQIASKVPVDPWGREYILRVRKKEEKTLVFLVSLGPDAKSAEDDIEHAVDRPKGEE